MMVEDDGLWKQYPHINSQRRRRLVLRFSISNFAHSMEVLYCNDHRFGNFRTWDVSYHYQMAVFGERPRSLADGHGVSEFIREEYDAHAFEIWLAERILYPCKLCGAGMQVRDKRRSILQVCQKCWNGSYRYLYDIEDEDLKVAIVLHRLMKKAITKRRGDT